MNANSTKLAIAAAVVLGGTLPVAQADVDEPSTVRIAPRHAGASTALDDESVRPLNTSRRPLPAIEQDIVHPWPRPPRQTRSADDEVVRPSAPVFIPERSLDGSLILTKPRRQQAAKPVPVPVRREAAEDPAGRASESGKPAREGKAEQ